MATTFVNNDNQMTIPEYQPVLLDPQLFSIPAEEDETDLDDTTVIENLVKKLPERSTPVRPVSDLSAAAFSTRSKTPKTRSYKFIQLERALTSANLLKTNDDRLKFETEYLHSLQKNTFDEFLQNYYQKLHDHYQHIHHEQELKKARIFTFFDLEKKFLALDPTRDVKILFLDPPTSSIITKTTNTRSTVSTLKNSVSAASEAAVESFYANRAPRLLDNPARAREEVTLFARRTAERLHERLPRLTSVPHRVKILDERDTTGKPDEQTLLQLKHKRALSLINKRRHIIMKMMTQTKKNQIKMEQQWNETPLAIDNSDYCRELLDRAKRIEESYREQQRPLTTIRSRRVPEKTTPSPEIMRATTKLVPVFSPSPTPFQDALSIHHIEKSKNIRVLRPTRPLTAPMKANWVNYC